MSGPLGRVLVTGGTGFLGRPALSQLVAAGYDVHAVTSRARAPEVAGVTWHRADLLDRGEPTRLVNAVRARHLLHLAWYVEHGEFWTSPLNARWVEASVELAHAFLSSGGRRLVAAGTCAEYDWSGDTACAEYATALRPATPYGIAKHALASHLMELGATGDLSVGWGRLFYPYGPGEHPKRALPSIIRKLLAGERAACTHSTQWRDYLHVDDAASAYVALLASDVTGPVNVASGTSVQLRTVFDAVARMIGGSAAIDFGIIDAPLNDPQVLVADVARLRDEVGWQPRVDLMTGLRETIDWWRANP